jgi:hypothetical protein
MAHLRAIRFLELDFEASRFFEPGRYFASPTWMNRRVSGVVELDLLRDANESVLRAAHVVTGDRIEYPHSLAYDGHVTRERSEPGFISERVGEDDGAMGLPSVPHMIAQLDQLAHLPGYPHADGRYRLRDAERTSDDEVTAWFAVTSAGAPPGSSVRTVFDRRVGYLPTQWETSSAEGEVLFRLKQVEYGRFPAEGNTLFYPTHVIVERRSTADEPFREEGRVRAIDGTVRINHDVPDERFVMAASPTDTIYRPGENRWTQRGASEAGTQAVADSAADRVERAADAVDLSRNPLERGWLPFSGWWIGVAGLVALVIVGIVFKRRGL